MEPENHECHRPVAESFRMSKSERILHAQVHDNLMANPPSCIKGFNGSYEDESWDAEATTRKQPRGFKKNLPNIGRFFSVFVAVLTIGFAATIGINTVLCKDEHLVDKDTFFNLSKNHYGVDYKDHKINATHFLGILEEMIKIRTISFGDKRDADDQHRIAFNKLLDEKFPHINKSKIVNKTVVNGSLLYEIRGFVPEKKPIMMMAHMDVVPAENLEEWTKHPFGEGSFGVDSSGQDPKNGEKDADKYLYGRGTLDVKSAIVGIFASLEINFCENRSWQPERTTYVFVGHDEEIGGYGGAQVVAEMLKNQGIELEFILDEGAAATRNYFPGTDGMIVGLIGVGEKGHLSVDIESTAEAGHSSMPRKDSSIENLAKAIIKISENSFPDHFEEGDVNRETFDWITPYTSLPYRAVFSNLWFFKRIVLSKLIRAPETRATVRTTTSFTAIEGGIKENVLPTKSVVTINHRLHPRETIEEVYQRNVNLLRNLKGVEVKIRSGWKNEATPISPHGRNDLAYHAIKSSIHNVFAGSIVVPYMTVGGTDSKHFVGLTNCIYRFVPYILDKSHDDAKRIHGPNERIKREGFKNFIQFYLNVLANADRF